ncbi:MAG: Alkaline phosphatase [Phycisphaerales bacterium]|nr:Alkaline phosphatase [Phycisphaerales bacterium]
MFEHRSRLFARRLARRLVVVEAVEARLLLAGSVQGIAWDDLNADGVLQSGEPLLSNWTLYLDANHNAKLDAGEVTTTSSASGAFSFGNLTAGNYLIGAVLKSGWSQTYPSAAVPAAAPPVAGGSTTAAASADSVTADSVKGAIGRSSNKSRYTAAQVDSASGWVIGLSGKLSLRTIVSRTGAASATASGVLPDTYILRFPAGVKGSKGAAQLARVAGVSFYYPLVAHALKSRFIPNDPLFSKEWNLRNTGQFGGLAGADANVTPVWDQYQGAGVVVGVVDDGLQYTHPDLAPNYDAIDSYDFNDNDPDPSPNSNDEHGTAVAGIVAAQGNNGIGVSGAAPQASIAGIRLTDTDTTDQQEASALSYHRNSIAIYSNSWGPDDNGQTLEGPGPLTLAALSDSVTNGRNGKGNVYVWASGNGLQRKDNVNYDGYANSRYVIAATALDDSGKQAYYAEPGAPILVSAYSGGVSPGITTTDLLGGNGYASGDYYTNFGGTSASAPLVSGVVALMLQANPNLTWRDVKHILVDTARKNDATDSGWSLNGAQHWVNHKYGFGAIDAAAAVNAVLNWTNVAPETSTTSGTINVNRTVPDNNTTGLTSSVTISSLIKVETVEVVFDATHPDRGDLRVVLTSPNGTKSVLAEVHGDAHANYSHWTFTSNRHWDEIAKGAWTLQVTDESGADVGTWNSWKLNIYGTAVTSEQYASVAANATVTAKSFGLRPLPGAKIAAASFPYQTGQRLVVTFDQDVAGSISAEDIEVRNDTTGQIVTGANLHLDYDSGTRTAVWTSPGISTLLADGNYTARLKASQITLANGGMLDGNGDGLGGDDFTLGFFQLNGDANRDRVVDTADFKILFANLGKGSPTWDQADFNYDGLVDFTDFQYLEQSFGHSLPSAAAPASTATSFGEIAPARLVTAPRPIFGDRPIRRRMDLLDGSDDVKA